MSESELLIARERVFILLLRIDRINVLNYMILIKDSKNIRLFLKKLNENVELFFQKFISHKKTQNHT
jgi:hypothetical protein